MGWQQKWKADRLRKKLDTKRLVQMSICSKSGRVVHGLTGMFYEAGFLTADPSVPFRFLPLPVCGERPLAYARGLAVEAFLLEARHPDDRLMLLDDDMPPAHNWPQLLTHDRDIVAPSTLSFQRGMAHGKRLPPTVFPVTYNAGEDGKYVPFMAWDGTEPFECDAADGCFIIKKRVLDQMKRPWFPEQQDPETMGITVGQDLGFYKKANALGFRVLVDPSVKFGHEKVSDAWQILGYAVEAMRRSTQSRVTGYYPGKGQEEDKGE